MKKCRRCGGDVKKEHYMLCNKCHKQLMKNGSINCFCGKGRRGRCRCKNFATACSACADDVCSMTYCCECI